MKTFLVAIVDKWDEDQEQIYVVSHPSDHADPQAQFAQDWTEVTHAVQSIDFDTDQRRLKAAIELMRSNCWNMQRSQHIRVRRP